MKKLLSIGIASVMSMGIFAGNAFAKDHGNSGNHGIHNSHKKIS